MRKICIVTLICIALSSCEVPQLHNDPEIEEIEKVNQTPTNKVKTTKQPSPSREKIISQPKVGQNKEKSFNSELNNLIQGTPKHPFPPENILD